jgi:hypothetical protein
MLDISVIEWEEHKPETLQKLRDTLDAEFEYLDHQLSMQGFYNAIKRFLKTERFQLKTRFLAGKDNCPTHVKPKSWERLKAYWTTNLQKEKAARWPTPDGKSRIILVLGEREEMGRRHNW